MSTENPFNNPTQETPRPEEKKLEQPIKEPNPEEQNLSEEQEDAPKYHLRESAKAALIPIVAKLNILKKETNIAPEKHEELKAKYKHLSRAVGMINSNKVDHSR